MLIISFNLPCSIVCCLYFLIFVIIFSDKDTGLGGWRIIKPILIEKTPGCKWPTAQVWRQCSSAWLVHPLGQVRSTCSSYLPSSQALMVWTTLPLVNLPLSQAMRMSVWFKEAPLYSFLALCQKITDILSPTRRTKFCIGRERGLLVHAGVLLQYVYHVCIILCRWLVCHDAWRRRRRRSDWPSRFLAWQQQQQQEVKEDGRWWVLKLCS